MTMVRFREQQVLEVLGRRITTLTRASQAGHPERVQNLFASLLIKDYEG